MQKLSKFLKLGIFVIAAGLTFASCDTTSINNDGKAPVTIRFQAAAATPNASITTLAAQTDKLIIKGKKGGAKLTITDIHFIVDDFELEQTDGECEGAEGKKEDDCEDFEKELFFVDLPLNGEPLELSTAPIKNGVYTALEFEIDDLDIDEDEDRDEKQKKQALLAKIRKEFPNWPKAASMVISGSYTADNGNVTEFTTFAEAEVSIEMELTPPLKIQDGSSKLITINIEPSKWFTSEDGTVVNLAQFSYKKVNVPMEFEAEIDDGFESTEVEED